MRVLHIIQLQKYYSIQPKVLILEADVSKVSLLPMVLCSSASIGALRFLFEISAGSENTDFLYIWF